MYLLERQSELGTQTLDEPVTKIFPSQLRDEALRTQEGDVKRVFADGSKEGLAAVQKKGLHEFLHGSLSHAPRSTQTVSHSGRSNAGNAEHGQCFRINAVRSNQDLTLNASGATSNYEARTLVLRVSSHFDVNDGFTGTKLQSRELLRARKKQSIEI